MQVSRVSTVQTKPLSRFGIDPDYDRFQQIIKGKTRDELRKFISPEKMNIIKEGKIVQLPKPVIELPRFIRGSPEEGGTGSGDGEEGDQIGEIGKDGSPLGPEAGDETADHSQEEWGPEVTRSEIARLIMEDLHLPNLEPKGNENVKQTNIKWTTISRSGNNVHVKATLKAAMRRSLIEQGENFKEDQILIQPQDLRYYSWQIEEKPHANAVIFYVLDVSGSVTDLQKEMARTSNFYLSTIIQHQFGELNAKLRDELFTDYDFGEGVEEAFITHDTEAREVTEKQFYTTQESGGTKISSAYKLIEKIIKERYDPSIWNVYVFHYTDGDNWQEDNNEALSSIERLIPQVNEVGYIQMSSGYANGAFKNALENKFGTKHMKLRSTVITGPNPEEYKRVIFDMLSEREGNENITH